MNLWDVVETPQGRGTVVEIQTEETGDEVRIGRLVVCFDGGNHRECGGGRGRVIDAATARVAGQYRPRGPVGWERNRQNWGGQAQRW